ncbi:hypothetical protein Tco_0000219 [Tanacetum coccineum]
MASAGSERDAKDALSKLLQMGTVVEHQMEFERLIKRVTEISESLLKSFYISELKVSLQIEVFSARPTTLEEAFSLARSLDANEEIKETHTRVHELVKQVEKLPMELQLQNNFREALETTSKDLEKKMIDLNLTLHDLQEVIIKCSLKIDDEEFKKAKSEATRKIRKLAKVYGAWLPPWLASHLVVYQPYVKNHWKEFMFIQERTWDPRINISSRQHLEGKVVVKE